jgi:hypothetical protein
MEFLGMTAPENKFFGMVSTLANWYAPNYIAFALIRVMNDQGNEPIKFLPFYLHVLLMNDYGCMLDNTGNLDADL